MADGIYRLFETLTQVPFNFWFYLMMLTAPLLVVYTGARLRAWKVFLAVGCTYVLINLSLHTSRAIIWRAYEACQSQFSDGAIQHHRECGEINIADGASNVFYLYFGWIPAATYVGIWALLWRWLRRKAIRGQNT
jgi:hypothetical protein